MGIFARSVLQLLFQFPDDAFFEAGDVALADAEGIGGFFLEPYMQATYAEFYAAMRSKALAAGMTTTDELGGFVRHDTF